ncbi:MAG: RNA-binding protein [Actinobacteria bacterium]|nr:RNA-binding protein [Actinomycetota bacterium]
MSEQNTQLETPEVDGYADPSAPVAGTQSSSDIVADDAVTDGGLAEGEDGAADDSAAEDGASAPRRGGRKALLEREGEVAADFLETLLDIADLDGDIDLDVDGDRAAVAIVDSDEGRVPRRLVGPGGKVLDALQELTRLAVQSATGERSRLMLDIAGHRAERRNSLIEAARVAIEECRSTGQPVDLEPMTAFERKVVHDEVLAAGLVSESSGVEPRRYVVVHPAAS